MPAPDGPVTVAVDGKVLYTTYDPRTHNHSIECDLCGLVVSAYKSGSAARFFDHRLNSECVRRRYMILENPDVDPALVERLTRTVPAEEPEYLVNRCPGAPYTWDHGTMWDSYSFHRHTTKLGWIPAGFSGDTVYIRADNCARAALESGHPCYACQRVVNSKRFRDVTGLSQGELQMDLPAHLRSYAHLLQSYRILAADRRRMRSQIQALQRSLRALRRKLEDYERIMLALSQKDIPRLRWLLTTAFKRGASPKRILSLVLRAAEGLYMARADADQYNLDIAYLVAALGGPRLLYALHHSHGLLSMTSVKKHHHYAQLLASVGVPTPAELNQNMSAFLDPAVWALPGDREAPDDASQLAGHTVMVDDVALEERAQYDQSRNEVVGLSRESVSRSGVSTVASSAEHIDTLASMLQDGSLRLAKQATAVVIAPVAEPENYSPVPLALSGSDKSEKGDDLRDWLARVLACYKEHPNGAPRRGPIWSLASDGDATFRWARHALCCTTPLPQGSPLHSKLSKLPGLNLHTSADGLTTATCDPKHIIKRFATLLRSQTGVRLGDTDVFPDDVLRGLRDVGGRSHISAVQLLDPADKQNVPKATLLMSELNRLHKCSIPPSIAASASLSKHQEALTVLSDVLNSFVQPFTDCTLSLTQQLESLATYAHSAAALFMRNRFDALTSALYADTQATVKNIFFMVARLQLLGQRRSLYLLHEGTDRLENVFGDLRTLNHARNFDLLEAARKLTTAFHINAIFRRNPKLDRGHRRLDLSAVVGVDHMNPKSWTGDVVVDGIDLEAVWRTGRQRAVSLLEPQLGPIDFSACISSKADFLRPDEHWVGVSKDASAAPPGDSRSERAESAVSEHIEPAVPRSAEPVSATPDDSANIAVSEALHDECELENCSRDDWNLDDLFDEEATASDVLEVPSALLDGTQPPIASSPILSSAPTSTASSDGIGAGGTQDPPLRNAAHVFQVNGQVFWKATYVKSRLSPSGGKKVALRPLRVRGVGLDDLFRKSQFLGTDDTAGAAADSVKRGDVAACFVHAAGHYNLAVFEIHGFRAPGKPLVMSMTPDKFAEHCEADEAVVVGQLLELRQRPSGDWFWTGQYVPHTITARSRSGTVPQRKHYSLEVPASIVHVLKPQLGAEPITSASGARSSRPTWIFPHKDLTQIFDEAWQGLDPASEDLFANAQLLPVVDNTTQLPYRAQNGSISFTITDIPAILRPVDKIQDDEPDEATQESAGASHSHVSAPRGGAAPVPQAKRLNAQQLKKQRYECRLCNQKLPAPKMRHHVGQHLLYAARSQSDPLLSDSVQATITPEACGWCGLSGGSCTTTITFPSKGAPVIRSSCAYHICKNSIAPEHQPPL